MTRKYFIVIALISSLILSGGCGGSNSSISQQQQTENEILLQSMTLNEKIGQLFIIRPEQLTALPTPVEVAKSSGDKELLPVMRENLKKYPAGGFILFAKNIRDPEQLINYMNSLEDACEIPPIFAIDEEGGLIARLGNNESFDLPKIAPLLEIGETGDPENAYNAGYTIGNYLNYYGFMLDFAPVADVIDPDILSSDNPISKNKRSFGSDPVLVSQMVRAFLDGLHANKVAGCIKHFPGHGSTVNDTHVDYAAITRTWDELLQFDLIPFIDNFDNTDLVMIEHITLENITSDDLPASLSKQLITGKLRNELGYDGLILTDSLEMGAINKYYPAGEAAVLALEAGNDILLIPYDYIEAFNAVLNAVNSGRISEERINQSVLRILDLKTNYELK